MTPDLPSQNPKEAAEKEELTDTPRLDPRVLYESLLKRFEVLRDFSPLAIGIDKQLFAAMPENSRKTLRNALRYHTQTSRYLKGIEKAKAGTCRFNLDSSTADVLSDENRLHAANSLRDRFQTRALEKQRAEEAKTIAEEKRKAEEAEKARIRQQEKLQQLAEKFARK